MSVPILMNPSYPIEVPDISDYQNYTATGVPALINFQKVKDENLQVKAVMVKFSEGDWSGYTPRIALDQAEGFYRAGLPVIPYHFWHYEVPPADQARRFKSVISQLSFQPRRFMVDIEDCDNLISNPPRTILAASEYPAWTKKAKLVANAVRDSVEAIYQAVGSLPLWYGGEWYQGWWVWLAGTAFDGQDPVDMSWTVKYKLHCASYTVPWMYLCTGFTLDQTLFWQWTSTPPLSKQIKGFPNPASLDMNYWLKSEAEFINWIGETPPVPELTDSEKLAKLWDAHPELHYE